MVHLVPRDEVRRRNCFAHGAPDANLLKSEATLAPAGGEPSRFLAYVMIAGVDSTIGIAGIQFGITYDGRPGQGVDVVSWVECGLYEWAQEDWPQAGSGNLITWHQGSDCQRTDPVVVGFFDIEVHSPDQLRIIPRPADGTAALANCGINSTGAGANSITYLEEATLGWAGFGGRPGYNPWNPEEYETRLAELADKSR
jgi:hypothetical protein